MLRSMRGCRGFVAVLALLAAGCGDDKAPVDGGNPLRFNPDSAELALMKRDPCWRRERSGWHWSIGHCRPMTAPQRIRGVWITAFEELSFLKGETRVPDPNDPRRYVDMIEFDRASAIHMAGRQPSNPNGEAYLLTFIGRRTRDPVGVDCLGDATFGYVVDRLLSVRYLGPVRPFDINAMKARARQQTVTHRHGGVWGQLEERAIKDCAPQRAG